MDRTNQMAVLKLLALGTGRAANQVREWEVSNAIDDLVAVVSSFI
jgi:hypothetical protein